MKKLKIASVIIGLTAFAPFGKGLMADTQLVDCTIQAYGILCLAVYEGGSVGPTFCYEDPQTNMTLATNALIQLQNTGVCSR